MCVGGLWFHILSPCPLLYSPPSVYMCVCVAVCMCVGMCVCVGVSTCVCKNLFVFICVSHCLPCRTQESIVLRRQGINYINNINMVSIMWKTVCGIKMRRLDNTILMIIVGEGIMEDLRFSLYKFLFLPIFYKRTIVVLALEVNEVFFSDTFGKIAIPQVLPPAALLQPCRRLGGLAWHSGKLHQTGPPPQGRESTCASQPKPPVTQDLPVPPCHSGFEFTLQHQHAINVILLYFLKSNKF